MNLYLNANSNPVTWTKKEYLLRAAKRLGLDVLEYSPIIQDPEYVLNIEPYDFVKGRKWTGIWEIDLLNDRGEANSNNWSYADAIFVAVSDIPGRLNGFPEKTHLLFQACDPDLHKPLPMEKIADLILSGSLHMPHYQKRIEALEIMKQNFKFVSFDNHNLPADYVGILNLAKVQFIRSISTPIADGEIAQRFFECLAIGPVLTNDVPDLKKTGLVEGEDYLAYRNDVEMIEKMKFLLDNPKEAEKIAKNGRRKALLYHTYDHRLVSIFNVIKYG